MFLSFLCYNLRKKAIVIWVYDWIIFCLCFCNWDWIEAWCHLQGCKVTKLGNKPWPSHGIGSPTFTVFAVTNRTSDHVQVIYRLIDSSLFHVRRMNQNLRYIGWKMFAVFKIIWLFKNCKYKFQVIYLNNAYSLLRSFDFLKIQDQTRLSFSQDLLLVPSYLISPHHHHSQLCLEFPSS